MGRLTARAGGSQPDRRVMVKAACSRGSAQPETTIPLEICGQVYSATGRLVLAAREQAIFIGLSPSVDVLAWAHSWLELD